MIFILLQVFRLQPRYAADLANVVPTVLSNMADVHQTCSDAAKRLQTAQDLPSLSGLIGQLRPTPYAPYLLDKA